MKTLNYRGVDVRFVKDGGFYILVSGGLAVRDLDKAWVRIYKTVPTTEYFEGYIDALIEMGNI